MKRLAIIGAGGHARVLKEALATYQGSEVIGCFDDDAEILRLLPNYFGLVNGIGSTRDTTKRAEVYEKFSKLGYEFPAIVHHTAYVASSAAIGPGVQILAGAIIGPNCRIDANTIINTKASVDHDCYIGEHCHIAPGATLSGVVHVMNNTHIGTGAVVIQGITIGLGCLITAGAIVVRNVAHGEQYVKTRSVAQDASQNSHHPA